MTLPHTKRKNILHSYNFLILKILSRLANLVPRVLRLFGQRFVARRDSGELEFYYRRISAVKQCKLLQGSQSKYLIFFEFSRVSPGAHPLTKKPEDSGYEIVTWLEKSIKIISSLNESKKKNDFICIYSKTITMQDREMWKDVCTFI